MRRVAEATLELYDLEVASLQLVVRATNRIYRVRSNDGLSFALRLASPGWRTRSDLESEAMWLEAIARDTTIPAPRILRASDGAAVVVCSADGVSTEHHATLMSWLPGVLLGRHLNERNLQKLGELFGQLHIHGAEWRPPPGFTARQFDQVFARGEPDVIFDAAQIDAHTPHTQRIVRLTRDAVDAAYAALDPGDLRVIHCDLWHDNEALPRSATSVRLRGQGVGLSSARHCNGNAGPVRGRRPGSVRGLARRIPAGIRVRAQLARWRPVSAAGRAHSMARQLGCSLSAAAPAQQPGVQHVALRTLSQDREAAAAGLVRLVCDKGGSRSASNEVLQRTTNSFVELTLPAIWRHTASAGSDPVSAVAG